ISDTLVPTTYLVDTTLSNASDSDQTVQAVRLLRFKVAKYLFFATGHSHGWLIPYCGIALSYNKWVKGRALPPDMLYE
ncbi:hypothetical protein ACP81E_24850, partial [Escherichia coli]